MRLEGGAWSSILFNTLDDLKNIKKECSLWCQLANILFVGRPSSQEWMNGGHRGRGVWTFNACYFNLQMNWNWWTIPLSHEHPVASSDLGSQVLRVPANFFDRFQGTKYLTLAPSKKENVCLVRSAYVASCVQKLLDMHQSWKGCCSAFKTKSRKTLSSLGCWCAYWKGEPSSCLFRFAFILNRIFEILHRGIRFLSSTVS